MRLQKKTCRKGIHDTGTARHGRARVCALTSCRIDTAARQIILSVHHQRSWGDAGGLFIPISRTPCEVLHSSLWLWLVGGLRVSRVPWRQRPISGLDPHSVAFRRCSLSSRVLLMSAKAGLHALNTMHLNLNPLQSASDGHVLGLTCGEGGVHRIPLLHTKQVDLPAKRCSCQRMLDVGSQTLRHMECERL